MELKKVFSFIFFSFLFIGCPNNYDQYDIKLDSFSIDIRDLKAEKTTDKDSLAWNNFGITFYYEVSLVDVISQTASLDIGQSYAHIAPYYNIPNDVIACEVENTNSFEGLGSYSDIADYFELEMETYAGISNLSLVNGISSTIKSQYKEGEDPLEPHLVLKDSLTSPYTGKFIVKLTLSDGTIFADTTRTINVY